MTRGCLGCGAPTVRASSKRCRPCYVAASTRPARQCVDCEKQLSAGNKSGRCAPCFNRHQNTDPAAIAQRKEAVRLYFLDPETRKRHAEPLRRAEQRPEVLAARGERFRACRAWEKGHAALASNPDARKRAGKRISRNKLAHVPEEYREEYKRLTVLGYSAAERLRIVLDQRDADVAKFRRSIGR